MKKKYQKPSLRVLEMQQELMQASSVTTLKSNSDMNVGGGSTVVGRSRGTDYWDDDMED